MSIKFQVKDSVRTLKKNQSERKTPLKVTPMAPVKAVKPKNVVQESKPNKSVESQDMRTTKLAQIRHLMKGKKCEEFTSKQECLNFKHCG